MSALQLLQGSVMKTTRRFLWLIKVQLLIESITDTLSKGIDSAASVAWLIANPLEVLFWVEGLGGASQFHGSVLCRHSPVLLLRVLSYVGMAGRGDGIVVNQTAPGVGSLHFHARGVEQNWVDYALGLATVGEEMSRLRIECCSTSARASSRGALLTLSNDATSKQEE